MLGLSDILSEMLKYFFVIISFFIFTLSIPFGVGATDDSFIDQSTVIINQIRGPECCDAGKLDNFKQQISMLDKYKLIGNFTLRYDALNDDSFVNIVKSNNHHQYGALLEITPSLAQAANVQYKGKVENWYEAQHVFLIGYTVDERYKLIDEYMSKFKEVFGNYPKFSGSWMIDPISLRYLKQKYKIVAHQITREQFGTDSYTLYGGPVHYPYYPTKNWALIPSKMESDEMPLIMRQTIMDPVHIYGDKSDSFTSQPNDYFFRNDTILYFEHLFPQAHSQSNAYTFALVSLENSMTDIEHDEYAKQMEVIKKWSEVSESHKVLSVVDYESFFRSNNLNKLLTVYSGESKQLLEEKAWWINTKNYRVRVRFSNNELFISDLRVYDDSFSDPYIEQSAKSHGWWIVPFVLDGSRYSINNNDGLFLRNDRIIDNSDNPDELIRIQILNNLSDLEVKYKEDEILFFDKDVLLASFSKDSFYLNEAKFVPQKIWDKYPLNNLKFIKNKKELWGFKKLSDNKTFIPFVSSSVDLDETRESSKSLLFPETSFGVLDKNKTYLYENNLFSIVGRNPSRLVFFPKNKNGENILISSFPKVVSQSDVNISFHEQHNSNGMLFIDFTSDKAQVAKITISHGEFNKEVKVYFAPNCKKEVLYCITHPIKSWWFMRSIIEDKIRVYNQQKSNKEKFQNTEY